jgi:hemolysin activation/secretion protein
MFNYNITSINDSIVPEKGIVFSANAGYTHNIKDAGRSFAHFGGDVQMYIPLVPKISLAISTGAATVTGTPEFYQYATIGGANSLRGYRTGRFSGKTAFYNSNEIRFITNIRSYYMNGKIGLLAFFDDGRVWLPSEKSDTWHTNYGGGILLVPFKLIYVDVTYGISKEDKLIQLRVRSKMGLK